MGLPRGEDLKTTSTCERFTYAGRLHQDNAGVSINRRIGQSINPSRKGFIMRASLSVLTALVLVTAVEAARVNVAYAGEFDRTNNTIQAIVYSQYATLFPGQSLAPGQSLRSGNNHVLIMQTDGNVVLYDRNSRPIWATNTVGIPPRELAMQGDGNLVLYATDGQPIWASNTAGNPGAFLTVQEDGNLVIYREGSQIETEANALWASGTYGQ